MGFQGISNVSHTSHSTARLAVLFLIVSSLLIPACSVIRKSLNLEIPLVPLEYVSSGSVVPWRAPIHIHDTQLQLAEYGAEGERQMRLYDETVFPTDVLVAYSETTQTVLVFLRRSPHGGCLLLWDADRSHIHDPCFGSNFDVNGVYISGPAQRNLDRLPASIRDQMVWVRNDVIYGEAHP